MAKLPIDAVDHIDRPVIALGRAYPDGFVIGTHRHRRGQLISSASGVIVLGTHTGTWVMPPERGLWIPPATDHNVRMVGAVSMQSLYLAPDAAAQMPAHCEVLGISPFMRSLMTEALKLPLEYDPDGRAGSLMSLIRHEMRLLPVLPLSLPYPAHDGLARRCRRFVKRPNVHDTIEDWSRELAMSRRAFTRLFRRETGLSFVEWRQQACLLLAMPRLVGGEPVTSVALDLGYENPAAFTIMFKRAFGAPPLTYLGLRRQRAPKRPSR